MVSEPEFIIPADRLPPGFADNVEHPPQPVEPKPAATVVLIRDGVAGLEALLLKRHRSSGFVPGAYVFPGGRTDAADDDEALIQHTASMPAISLPRHFWFAAVREVFEESGVLLARDADGSWAADASSDERMEQRRLTLMDDHATLLDVLRAGNYTIDLSGVVYFAHWITPVAEPRRYDTRFFAAVLPDGRTVRPDPREMTDAQWLTPGEALKRFSEGRLPMVFPTVKTLQHLSQFASTGEAIETLRRTPVDPVLPRLVRTDSGVGIVIDPK